jgi:hypothetical protein
MQIVLKGKSIGTSSKVPYGGVKDILVILMVLQFTVSELVEDWFTVQAPRAEAEAGFEITQTGVTLK